MIQRRPLPRASLVGDARVGRVNSEGRGEGDEVVLLLHQNFANRFTNSKLVELVALLDPTPVLADRLSFIFKIEAQHVLGLFGGFDRFWRDRWHPAKVVNVIS